MTDMSDTAVLARHVEVNGRCHWCGGQQWPCDAFTLLDLAEQATALRDELLVQHQVMADELEAARLRLRLFTDVRDCGHGRVDVMHVAPSHFLGRACPECSDARYADMVQDREPCGICTLLATDPPSAEDVR